ncbi:Putative beta-barrel porin-2, OmpL-like. bbp2 [Nitrosospira briensis]|uniref:Putative beta-barrel porin-2, OmpL-like. bbp2 n=1 Tax=Nitrosospira briensis TaxID=35799 RepID=A0A1I4YSQ3_9PROT|nr:porin [Nitrosospira briensis]SFN41054.1 Putative beta-barrel porin-2, OmpL-like. bbp2 [Nitrosospira briensis]
MNHPVNNKGQAVSALISLLLFAGLTAGAAYANNLTNYLKESRLELGGWINGGATHNANNPADGFNGPVTFADRSNRFQLNQFNLFVQRPVPSGGAEWGVGGRFDFLFGTDAIYTQAYGISAFDENTGAPSDRGDWDLDLCCKSTRTYGIALPQAYLEAYVPFGNGLNIKAGHFYTPLGYETVPAPDNFFYTRTFTVTSGEPFTHTGLLGNYTVDANWSVIGGATTGSAKGGWDGGFDKQWGNWGGVAAILWTSDDRRTSANLGGTYGETATNDPWMMYSVVLQHRITPRTHMVLHHTYGWAADINLPGGIRNAEWYSINTHLTYDLFSDLSIGIRAERFTDRNGWRVASPNRILFATNNKGVSYAGNIPFISAPANYYAVTVGMNWKPARRLKMNWRFLEKLNIRPNVRYDRADGINRAFRPFDGRKDQFLFSLDATIPF